MPAMPARSSVARCILAIWLGQACMATPLRVRYMSWAESAPVFAAFAGAPETRRIADAAAWNVWIRSHDAEVRARVDRGVEDSITNLILFGTSFTGQPPAAAWSDAVGAQGELTPTGQHRLDDFTAALNGAAVARNHRLATVRGYLAGKHVAVARWRALLAANILRYAREQGDYERRLREAQAAGDAEQLLLLRGSLYEKRGLSVDTSLMPNLAISDTLRVLREKGVLQAGAVRRIAVIGPGLDFADKRQGLDYYPEQTLQPFAVADAAVQLGLAQAEVVRVATLDLNPLVNTHVAALERRAQAGLACILQLPLAADVNWTPAALAYWKNFGLGIGKAVTPIAPPKELGQIETRAVAVLPPLAARLTHADVDAVAQVAESVGERFDLIVATNVLVYYNRFEQALALANVATMLAPAGIFVSNTVLPAIHDPRLRFLGRRNVSYTNDHAYGDDIVVYQRIAGDEPR